MADLRRPPESKPDKKYLYHILFFLLSVILVVLISPREGKFRYEFQKGKPWLRPALIAPWDFPVLKPSNLISKERDSILKNLAPYFKLDTMVEVRKAQEFDKYLNDLLTEYESENQLLPAMSYIAVKREMITILSDIYKKGILESNEIIFTENQTDRNITIIKGKVAEQKSLNSFFLQKDAYLVAENAKKEIAGKYSGPSGILIGGYISRIAFYNFITPNLFYDEVTTTDVRDKMIKDISLNRGLVQEGELIISRGEIVNDSKFTILESLKKEYEKRLGMYDRWLIILGRIILVSSCYLALYMFLYHFRFDILSSTKKTFFIILIILLFLFITRLVIFVPTDVIYLVPFAIIPVLIRTFYDSRLALFVYMISIMLAGFFVPNSFEFVFINYIVGVIVILSLTNIYKRAKLFLTAFLAFVTYSVVYFGIGIMQEGSLENMNWSNYICFAGNGVFLLLTYPLIFVFEKTFSFLSDATLFELADTNQPLLRLLADKAPGSFQHSLQVANLAEEAAREIEADNLLARTGALYHDIGKILNSEYFVENQAQGFNPHDKIAPVESSKIIINHVKAGVDLALKHSLPSAIIDFINTHHGTSVAFYFYKKFQDINPKSPDMRKNFTYPGPRPFTKETAIVMMADAVEASSRTLQNYSEENISELVDRIIYIQEQDGQFSETPLTFKDISDIKKVFVKRLLNIYHPRIAYPGR